MRFVQLFHRGWDQHRKLPAGITEQTRITDQASAALGIDHERLTFRFQGRDYRLTDVHGRVVEPLLG